MKIIDEKGKLFGFINVVDLIILAIILALIGGVAFRLVSSKVNARNANPFSEQEDIYVTLYSGLVVPEISSSLKVGDKLVANNSFTNAEIVSISAKPADYVSTNAEGEAVLSEHPLWQDVTVVVKDKVQPSNIILKVGGQEARVGYSFILKTQTVETNCKIRGISFGEPPVLDTNTDVTADDDTPKIEGYNEDLTEPVEPILLDTNDAQ